MVQFIHTCTHVRTQAHLLFHQKKINFHHSCPMSRGRLTEFQTKRSFSRLFNYDIFNFIHVEMIEIS